MKVFGYYVDVPDLKPEDELKLTILWRERWTAAGFEPFVLNEYHAKHHPLFEQLNAVVMELPTTNPRPYERACYLRWLALAQCGGGFLSDFDVIPYCGLIGLCGPLGGGRGALDKLHLLANRSPALTYASKEICEKLCQAFIGGTLGKRMMGDKPHYSDQYAIEDITEDWVRRIDVVKEYTDVGWESAPAVHYANRHMGAGGKLPRYQHIPLLRA